MRSVERLLAVFFGDFHVEKLQEKPEVLGASARAHQTRHQSEVFRVLQFLIAVEAYFLSVDFKFGRRESRLLLYSMLSSLRQLSSDCKNWREVSSSGIRENSMMKR